jgi:hypothetical protein
MALRDWFQRRPTPEQEMLSQMVMSMTELVGKTVQAVEAISVAAQRQSEVTAQYLKLFSTPGEPSTWQNDPVADNDKELATLGFPKDKSEREQAEWVLAHMDQL